MSYLWRDWQGEDKPMNDKEYTNSQIEHLINEHIHSARNREILKARLIDGMCFEPIAEKFDLSVQHVKSIVYKEQIRLFKRL